ncbi:hypothetical protein COP2_036190 [Malus domestica]
MDPTTPLIKAFVQQRPQSQASMAPLQAHSLLPLLGSPPPLPPCHCPYPHRLQNARRNRQPSPAPPPLAAPRNPSPLPPLAHANPGQVESPR